jgi:hypothetical protein
MTTVHQPLYARMLRLRHVAPSGFLCFVYLEGAVALGILLALAELVSWWGVLALPATVAVMVKLNDSIAGSLVGTAAQPTTETPWRPVAERPPLRRAVADAGVGHAGLPAGHPGFDHASAERSGFEQAPAVKLSEDATRRLPGVIDGGRGAPVKRPWVEKAEAQQQWIRQSATRRYE